MPQVRVPASDYEPQSFPFSPPFWQCVTLVAGKKGKGRQEKRGKGAAFFFPLPCRSRQRCSCSSLTFLKNLAGWWLRQKRRKQKKGSVSPRVLNSLWFPFASKCARSLENDQRSQSLAPNPSDACALPSSFPSLNMVHYSSLKLNRQRPQLSPCVYCFAFSLRHVLSVA